MYDVQMQRMLVSGASEGNTLVFSETKDGTALHHWVCEDKGAEPARR